MLRPPLVSLYEELTALLYKSALMLRIYMRYIARSINNGAGEHYADVPGAVHHSLKKKTLPVKSQKDISN